MTSFSDLRTAAKVRDLMRTVAVRAINEHRPTYQYGTVTSMGSTLAQVRLVGDRTDTPAALGSAVPAVGQMVRVAGLPGDRYIDDVLPIGAPPTPLPVVTGVELAGSYASVIVSWTPNFKAASYEVQVSPEPSFRGSTLSARVVGATQKVFASLTTNMVYYARVAGVDTANNYGPWSSTAVASTWGPFGPNGLHIPWSLDIIATGARSPAFPIPEDCTIDGAVFNARIPGDDSSNNGVTILNIEKNTDLIFSLTIPPADTTNQVLRGLGIPAAKHDDITIFVFTAGSGAASLGGYVKAI